jgi:hypothetical protein
MKQKYFKYQPETIFSLVHDLYLAKKILGTYKRTNSNMNKKTFGLLLVSKRYKLFLSAVTYKTLLSRKEYIERSKLNENPNLSDKR